MTPIGELLTALDKFVHSFVTKGFEWEFDNNDIIFTKDNETIRAFAQFNEKGWINGYNYIHV